MPPGERFRKSFEPGPAGCHVKVWSLNHRVSRKAVERTRGPAPERGFGIGLCRRRVRMVSLALTLVAKWAPLHHDELLANWERARREEPLEPIDPLP
jgi:hypothetical protein